MRRDQVMALPVGATGFFSAVARPPASDSRWMVATLGELSAAGAPVPVELTHQQADMPSRRCRRWWFQRDGRTMSTVVGGRARFGVSEGVRVAVLSDMELAAAVEWMSARERANRPVARRREGWLLPPSRPWARQPSGWQASPPARRSANLLAGLLAQPAWQPSHVQRQPIAMSGSGG